MRRLPIHLLAAAMLLASACGGNTAPETAPDSPAPSHAALDDTLHIALGEERSADGGRIAVRFVARVSESRCPANVTCVWEGDASVRLRVRVDGATGDTVLHTNGQPNAMTHRGYVITVPGLLPYPGTYPDDRPEPAATVLVHVVRP